MHTKLERYVNDGFMTEGQAQYIEGAIERGETLIASGHRSAGIRNLMAAVMSMVMEKHSSTKVKDAKDTESDTKYLLIPAFAEDTFLDTLQAAFNRKGQSLVTMKDPDHPYSVIKMMTVAYKTMADPEKVVNLMECNKIDGEPKLIKFSKMTYNEKGKVVREDKEVMA
ncbi:MAG TPA: hypothetical protein GXZ64_02950 [Clostridiaceae bacterium]|nr:hypothetical protein [Clostridiaceae bacterium]